MRQAQLSFDQLTYECAGVARQLLVAGVDEVGRGPLAGNVVAAAVILDPTAPIAGLTDSKKLSEKKREALNTQIRQQSLCWAIGQASVAEIDCMNILHASMLAMSRAIEKLSLQPDHCLIDGNRCPTSARPCQAIVGGDALVSEIAAASIIAKVERDQDMQRLHADYPQYGFDRHKGYPTRQHIEAIKEHGILSHHRRSFAPVRACIEHNNENFSATAKAFSAQVDPC